MAQNNLHRVIKKKQKQKPMVMVKPPPPDNEPVEVSTNRIHQRQNIINELDLIKARVDKIIGNFEDKEQSNMFSVASMSVPVETLDGLLRKHISIRTSKEKELSSVREFFTKCCNLAKCLEETVMTTAEERANDQSILREDFESAYHNTTEKIHQIKSLNAQMIAKLTELLEHQKLKSQFVKVGDPELRLEEIINMYTNEALKRTKLERTVANNNDELQLLKSRNLYLTEKNEADESKLQEAEWSRKELEEIIKKQRTEINTLKYQRKSLPKTDYKRNFVDYNQSNNTSTNLDDNDEHQKLQSTTPSAVKSPTTPSPNNAPNQQHDSKKVPSRVTLQTKKQVATKYTSKLLDQQLNYMEELMLQGQQNVEITKKELSELSHITDEALKQKYQEEYSCLCDSVHVVTLLLGSQGTERLTAEVKCAAPENLFGQHDGKPVFDLLKDMKKAVSRVILELKLFIKLKRKQTASSTKADKTQKKVVEVQKWLDHELNGINEEIMKAIERYQRDKKGVEKFHTSYFDQFSKKIESNTQKLSKTLEKLKLPDYSETKTMLENISSAVKQKPETTFKQLVHEYPKPATVEETKVSDSVDTIAEIMQKINTFGISTIDTIRNKVASHLKTVHGVTISSKSWRTKATNRKTKPPLLKKTRISNRQLLLPALASCVEYEKGKADSSKSIASLPTIQKPKASQAMASRSHHYKNYQNQNSVQTLPTVVKAAELSELKMEKK